MGETWFPPRERAEGERRSREKGEQSLAFGLEFVADCLRKPREGLDLEALLLDLPCAGDEAVDEDRLRHVAVRRDYPLAVAVGEDSRALGGRIGEQ